MERKYINKSIREQVYQKYDGHCAYCGCEIEFKDMQCDHLLPVYRPQNVYKDINNIDNLMPSCRQCNYYKNTFTLERFRQELKTLMERVRKPLIYRLASKYGMVKEGEWDGNFYFERLKE